MENEPRSRCTLKRLDDLIKLRVPKEGSFVILLYFCHAEADPFLT